MAARKDADVAVGDRVLVYGYLGNAKDVRGQEAVVNEFGSAGFTALLHMENGADVWVLTSQIKVLDAIGLCAPHKASRCPECCVPEPAAPVARTAMPRTTLRGGCGWLVAFDDGRVRCTNQHTCTGPHTVEVVTGGS